MPRVSRPAAPASRRKHGEKPGVAARQLAAVEDLAGVQRGERDLARADEVELVVGQACRSAARCRAGSRCRRAPPRARAPAGCTGSKPCPRSFSSAQRTSASSTKHELAAQVGEARAGQRAPRSMSIIGAGELEVVAARRAGAARLAQHRVLERRVRIGQVRQPRERRVELAPRRRSAPRRAPCARRRPRACARSRSSASSPRDLAAAIAWLASFCCARRPSTSGISSRRRASSARISSTALGRAAAGERIARGVRIGAQLLQVEHDGAARARQPGGGLQTTAGPLGEATSFGLLARVLGDEARRRPWRPGRRRCSRA